MRLQDVPVIKWSGSKRSQAHEIIKTFPTEINTYYEPFIGGGSVMFKMLHSGIKCKKIICSDINSDLMELWRLIKSEPNKAIESYTKTWTEFNSEKDIGKKKENFKVIRERFNKNRDGCDFLFLNRTCYNGLIRYNSKNEFNVSLHFSRKGIDPTYLAKVITYWSQKINEYNVEFLQCNYNHVATQNDDFLYVDPPYTQSQGMYYGTIDYTNFFGWLKVQKGKYTVSFGTKEDDQLPNDLYNDMIKLYSGRSSFRNMKNDEVEYVYENLFVKNKLEIKNDHNS